MIFNQGLVTAHEPLSGELLWKQPWPPSVECVSQPVPLPDDKLLVSSGYGVGAKLFQISRNPMGEFNVSIIWETIYLKAKFTNIIYYNDYLYGLDDGIFACINPADGTRQWKQGRYGHGQTLLISDVLLVLAESGEVVLVDPNPNTHIEHARFAAVKVELGTHPHLPVIIFSFEATARRRAISYRLLIRILIPTLSDLQLRRILVLINNIPFTC